MMIGNHTTLKSDLIVTSLETSTTIDLSGNDTLLYGMFKVNDILSIQVINDQNLRIDYWFKVTTAKALDGSGNIKVIPVSLARLDDLPPNGKFSAGSVVRNWKQGTTSTGIRLVGTSVLENAPFIDMFEAEQQLDETYNISSLPKLRIGNLSGINDPDFTDLDGNPIPIHGYGLYAENAYIKGKIVAEYATITNSTLTGNVYAGTGRFGNILLRDRAVENDSSEDGYYMCIYPDDNDQKPDTTKYSYLAYESGIFIRNYPTYYFHDDGLDVNPSFATGLISPPEDLILFNKLGNYFVHSTTNYMSGLLANNSLRFTDKKFAETPNILNYDLDQTPIVEYGLTHTNSSYYGFIGVQEGIPSVFGVSKTIDNISQIDTTKRAFVGINTTSPMHDLHVNQSIGMGEGLYFVDGGENKIKAVKFFDGDNYSLDFFIL